jgi:hypothetical protein
MPKIAIYATNVTFISIVCSRRELFAALPLDDGPLFPNVYEACLSEGRSVALERWLMHAARVSDEQRRPSSMPCGLSASGAVPQDHGLLPSDPLDMYFVRRSRKRTLFYSIGDSWNAMMFVMKHVPEGEPMLVNKWSVFDPSTLLSSGSMTQLSPEAIAVMTRVQAQDPVLCRQKR